MPKGFKKMKRLQKLLTLPTLVVFLACVWDFHSSVQLRYYFIVSLESFPLFALKGIINLKTDNHFNILYFTIKKSFYESIYSIKYRCGPIRKEKQYQRKESLLLYTPSRRRHSRYTGCYVQECEEHNGYNNGKSKLCSKLPS